MQAYDFFMQQLYMRVLKHHNIVIGVSCQATIVTCTQH